MKYALIVALALTACAKKSTEASPTSFTCVSQGVEAICGGKTLDFTHYTGQILSVAVVNGGKFGPCVTVNFTNQTDITYCGTHVNDQNQLSEQPNGN